ncbi:mitochondrial ribosomal subunit protein-domain-containing protein [Lentinula detonsa]|uniref:Mitochondrial ribosomal subunit protein-domain-containing protein n=1 Tax=Lentinula detonsa TaxID=2804962 RepID=A0AA38UUU0_9AGAR|nr:mitochondrial ribosomal subunit protein-domain-containing protein [Lentinula detonsa]
MSFLSATGLGRAVFRPAPFRAPIYTRPHFARNFHASCSVSAAQRSVKSEELVEDYEAEDMLDYDFDDDDTTSAGHLMLREQRQTLYYLRLIEHEMPKLVAYRKPFVVPKDSPLIVRSLEYGGEDHPATSKRVVVVAVDDLLMTDKHSVHKIKLLAGPRWSLKPPANSGVSDLKSWGNGFIKISCEDFLHPAQNLKWISDTLDRLIGEANNKKDTFADVPQDVRHIYSVARKAKLGEHLRGRVHARPTIRDFPQDWLPDKPISRPGGM